MWKRGRHLRSGRTPSKRLYYFRGRAARSEGGSDQKTTPGLFSMKPPPLHSSIVSVSRDSTRDRRAANHRLGLHTAAVAETLFSRQTDLVASP